MRIHFVSLNPGRIQGGGAEGDIPPLPIFWTMASRQNLKKKRKNGNKDEKEVEMGDFYPSPPLEK